MSFATAFTEAPVDVDPSTGKGPEWGKAAPIGLLVILLLVIATFFLLRSMVRKINKVPASFDPPDEDAVDPMRPTRSQLGTLGGCVGHRFKHADPGTTDLAAQALPDSRRTDSSCLVNERRAGLGIAAPSTGTAARNASDRRAISASGRSTRPSTT